MHLFHIFSQHIAQAQYSFATTPQITNSQCSFATTLPIFNSLAVTSFQLPNTLPYYCLPVTNSTHQVIYTNLPLNCQTFNTTNTVTFNLSTMNKSSINNFSLSSESA